MDFSAYWKEVSVVLAALFTIAGAVFEVRDRRSKQFTIWGKLFFSPTALSMIGGFYAQWLDNSNENKKSQEAQANMLKLITDTSKSVYNITRLLEPLGKSNITAFFDVDCDKLKDFCDDVRVRGEKAAEDYKITGEASLSIDGVDWTKWPSGYILEEFDLFIFRQNADANKMIDSKCLRCDWMGDLHFDVYTMGKPANQKISDSTIIYDTKDKKISIMISGKDVTPKVHNDNVMSMIDIPGSIVIVTGSQGLTNFSTLDTIFVENERGQKVTLKDPKISSIATGERYFKYQVPK
jgi:hypothetical protein